MAIDSEPVIALRFGTRDDVRQMWELDCLCFAPEFRFSLRTMARFAGQANASTLLAEHGGELLGFVLAHRENSALYVVTLDVHPAARRKGVARRLLLELARLGRESAANDLMLHVWTENLPARAFYGQAGFLPIGEEPDFYGHGLHAMLLCKTL